MRGISSARGLRDTVTISSRHAIVWRAFIYRGVAQLVARTAGGREVASSSLVTPTKLNLYGIMVLGSLLGNRLQQCKRKVRAT